MLRGYTQWPRQCRRVIVGMHVLPDQSVVSMSNALNLVKAALGLNSVTIIHQDIHTLSGPLFIDPPVFQLTAFDIY